MTSDPFSDSEESLHFDASRLEFEEMETRLQQAWRELYDLYKLMAEKGHREEIIMKQKSYTLNEINAYWNSNQDYIINTADKSDLTKINFWRHKVDELNSRIEEIYSDTKNKDENKVAQKNNSETLADSEIPKGNPPPDTSNQPSTTITSATIFGKLLGGYRKQARLSQRELAERASLTRPHVTHLEAGDQDPRLSTILKLADALDIEPTALIPQRQPRGR